MPRPMKKAERRRFVKGIIDYLLSIGAVYDGEWYYDIETPVGLLRVRPDENTIGGPGSVFCRFDEPKRAKEAGVGCNPHSGKWNHHYFDGWPVEIALEDFQAKLGSVLAGGNGRR